MASLLNINDIDDVSVTVHAYVHHVSVLSLSLQAMMYKIHQMMERQKHLETQQQEWQAVVLKGTGEMRF